MHNIENHIDLMIDFLSKKQNPTILEFGVERGSSTKKFISLAEKNSGKVFSVDITDCSEVSNSKSWEFLQSNDLNVDYVLDQFNEIKKNGVDLIFIDSCHEANHVQKLISYYFAYLKEDGAIFVDDVDSFPLRLKKKIWNSIVYDLTLDSVKEFYYNNTENCSLKFFFNHKENGLAMIYKKNKFGTEPNKIKKIWNYNIIFKIIYPLLKKTSNLCKSIFKRKV
tara:strand:+ start:149 stop:817 length:669 start_codon:yes stop_codon:yes gene_type:complete